MIPTLLDVLCHRAPYFNRKNYLDKVPAETIGNFNTATQKVHETMRPKLAGMWKEWAAKNSDSLKSMVTAPPESAGDDYFNDEFADIVGN
jgi:hypothetical protein